MKSDMCREKLKCKRKVYRRRDGRQELRFCIRSGISLAANGVHSYMSHTAARLNAVILVVTVASRW